MMALKGHFEINWPLLIGIKQAHAAGKVFKDTIFHQAYSSDLKRANKTCQIILEENQRSSIKSNDIHGMFLEWWKYTLAKTEIIYPINVGALVAMNFT